MTEEKLSLNDVVERVYKDTEARRKLLMAKRREYNSQDRRLSALGEKLKEAVVKAYEDKGFPDELNNALSRCGIGISACLQINLDSCNAWVQIGQGVSAHQGEKVFFRDDFFPKAVKSLYDEYEDQRKEWSKVEGELERLSLSNVSKASIRNALMRGEEVGGYRVIASLQKSEGKK